MPRLQAWRSSGLSTVFSKWKTTAVLYSRKNRAHSSTDGVLGGQAAVLP